jgi:tRNA-2-methylthio-N6-dimethylallyladenosine synthase
MKYYLKTYGCQMNVHDSEKIAGIFSESGYEQAEGIKDADVVIINTCSVRQKAEQKVYTELGRLRFVKERNPNLKIAVAGCIAQQKGNALFERFPQVDFVFGPGNIDSLEKWISKSSPRPHRFASQSEAVGRRGASRTHTTALKDNPGYSAKNLPIKREGQVKAWVSIMYGCDNFCSYCVVPFTRGRERSRQSSDIYNEIRTLADQGFKEVTLLGQNVNSYGKNLSETIDFPNLLKVIHEIHAIQRIRFVTSHPRDLSEKLIGCMRNLPKICEHIHLPVQSGSDKILNLMNRGYIYKEYKTKIDILRSAVPDIAITSDIIVGFPGETDEDFRCTMNALSEIEFDGIFAFKYSKRPDTKALSLLGHIDEKIKAQRLSEVLHLQESITYKKNKALENGILEVLVEGVSETDADKLTGRTRTNKIVNFYGDPGLAGNLVTVKIIEAKQHSLYGEMI